MSTTANDIISGALRVVSSLSPGEAIPGNEAANALTVLNRMYAAWSAKSLMIPFRTLESFTLTIGKASYTIGQNGSPDFNTVRPDYLTWAWRRDVNNVDYPLEILSKERYNAIQLKSLESLPYQLYYDPQYPNGVIYLYPTDIQQDTLFIESLKPVNQFSSLTATLQMPGEYYEASVYLLAQRLAPEYGFSIAGNPDIAELVKEADEFIKRKNTKMKNAGFDRALRPSPPFNIFQGY